MAGGRLSSDVELMSVRSEATDTHAADQAFPSFYRRENIHGASTSGEYDRRKVRSPPRLADEDLGDDRVEYVPMPEEKKLGYFSTAALIVSKMIGTGVFAKPSVVLVNCGGKGVALFLWVACGLMSMAGYGCQFPLVLSTNRCGRLLIYVEMGITLPFSGAEVVYVRHPPPATT